MVEGNKVIKMDLQTILQDEASTLFSAEEAMKQKLDDLRRMKRNASSAIWQENLGLVTSSAEERKEWAITIEKDSLAGKSIKRTPVSDVFMNGPRRSAQVVLAKLIVQAAVKAKVKLPKQVLLDLEKSGLANKYAELCESEGREE